MDLPRREPTDGPLTFEELGLAVRNRSLPLEAMRWDTTPPGLHYLLVHFDIPAIDAATWRLRVGGLVDRPLERASRTSSDQRRDAGGDDGVPATVARASSQPVSQPWLGEAIGTAHGRARPWRRSSEAGLGRCRRARLHRR
jgi:DMSO/TMAO reductase YedYZ molybdopterin-dependent catalytic subunit